MGTDLGIPNVALLRLELEASGLFSTSVIVALGLLIPAEGVGDSTLTLPSSLLLLLLLAFVSGGSEVSGLGSCKASLEADFPIWLLLSGDDDLCALPPIEAAEELGIDIPELCLGCASGEGNVLGSFELCTGVADLPKVVSDDAPSGPLFMAFFGGAGADLGILGILGILEILGIGSAGICMGPEIGEDDDAPKATGSGVEFKSDRFASDPIPCVESAMDCSNFASSCPLLLLLLLLLLVPLGRASLSLSPSASRFVSFDPSVPAVLLLFPLFCASFAEIAATAGSVDPCSFPP